MRTFLRGEGTICRGPRREALQLPLLLLPFLILAASCTPAPPSSPAQAPAFRNLVLILVDTLRADHVSAYGYTRPTTPFLDRLAKEGLQLEGYSASSWTKASVATLLTALHPQRHQAISRSDALPEDLAYLPDLLHQAGFRTAAYVGNRNVARRFAFDRGYDHFLQCRPTGKVDGVVVTHHGLKLADRLAGGQRKKALGQTSGSPLPSFFLQVHYVDPHDPYRPETPWDSVPGAASDKLPQPARLRSTGTPLDAITRQRLVDQYDGEIREVDAEIQRFLDGLEERGLLEDTLVVVTSDHGEEFGDHGGLTHGSTLFEEVLRVPLILWAKEFWSKTGRPTHDSHHRFHQVDLLPTLLEALGLPPVSADAPTALDGSSRWQQILGSEGFEEPPYFFHLDLDRRGALALLTGTQKVIHRTAEPHTLSFDLQLDPQELNPLPGSPTTEGTLETLLRHHNRQRLLARDRHIETLDDETRRSLAALGYLAMDTPEAELGERVVPAKLGRRGFQP